MLGLLSALGGAADAAAQSCELGAPTRALVAGAVHQIIQTQESRLAANASEEAAAAAAVVEGLAPQWPLLVSRTALFSEAGRLAAARTGPIGEIVRRDTQVGASSDSSGTTTLTQDAALPLLLGLALEHGAITQEEEGESITLRTTPYGLLLAAGDRADTDDFYREHWVARSLGLSANLALDPEDGVNDLEASELSALSARYVFGDRSTRSEEFQRLWAKTIQPEIQQRLELERVLLDTTLGGPLGVRASALIADDAGMSRIGITENTRTRLTRWLQTSAPRGVEERRAGLSGQIEEELCENVHEWMLKEEIHVAERSAMRALAEAVVEAETEVRERTIALVEAYQADQPLLSLVYSWNRIEEGSDYSQVVLVGDGLFGGLLNPHLRIVVNGSVSINHAPSATLDQERFREYKASVKLQNTVDNLLTRALPGNSPFSRIGISLSGSYMRQRDIDQNIGSVQARFELPLAAGFVLPISLSWSTRTETSSEEDFKVGVGVLFNADTLAALAQLGAL